MGRRRTRIRSGSKTHDPDTQSKQDMIDAIREMLGLRPLYNVTERPLPGSMEVHPDQYKVFDKASPYE